MDQSPCSHEDNITQGELKSTDQKYTEELTGCECEKNSEVASQGSVHFEHAENINSPKTQIMGQPISHQDGCTCEEGSNINPQMAQPIGQQPMTQPMGQQPMTQPMGQQPMGQPIGQQPMGQPIGQQPMGQPMGQQPMGQPIGQQPMGQPIGQQPMGGQPVQFMGQPSPGSTPSPWPPSPMMPGATMQQQQPMGQQPSQASSHQGGCSCDEGNNINPQRTQPMGHPGQPSMGYSGRPQMPSGHSGCSGPPHIHHDANQYGQIGEVANMFGKFFSGEASVDDMVNLGNAANGFFNLDVRNTHFWTGTIVGVAAALLLSNDTVKECISKAFSIGDKDE
ncbi:hypothetical protein GMMP13_380043 [Candidatus Magnetomoraceae bacterium gMMP-13]